MRNCWSFFCCFLFFVVAFGQETTPTSLPIVKTKNDSDTIKPHSVLKAALFSAVIPGSGQIYNHIAMPKGQKKAFWKVPLIYAGLGATGYFVLQNHRLQRDLRAEYIYREVSGFTLTKDSRWEDYDAQAVLTLYQKHQNQRDLLIMGFGVVYLLQVADAAIEAHFVRFDISDNLSLQIRPSLIPTSPYLQTMGLNVALKFKK